PIPSGDPGSAGLGVTGTSRIADVPPLAGESLSGWYGFEGAPRWSSIGRILQRRTHRPGKMEESHEYPSDSRMRRASAVMLKFGARKCRGVLPNFASIVRVANSISALSWSSDFRPR